MEATNSQCCVCLNCTPDAVTVTNHALNQTSWREKLQNVVPEVEWLVEDTICSPCRDQLSIAYDFRSLCIRRVQVEPQPPVIYTCFHCNAGFADKDTLATHITTCLERVTLTPSVVKNLPQFKCDHCGKSCTTRRALTGHLKTCPDQSGDATAKRRRQFSCEVCHVVLRHAKTVVEHCVTVHSMPPKTVKPYTCDECPMRFCSSTNLIQHKKYHTGSRSHVCSFCGKAYITKSDLTVHEYTHRNRRNYKCPQCDKAFNTNKNLCSHKLVVHTEARLWKYRCELCDRRFPLKSGYDQHVRRHTGDKRFVCHICGKPFVSRSELQKHMTHHSKIRPHKCPHCEKAYKERRMCAIHLAKAHGEGDARVPVRVKKFVCHMCPSTFFDRQKLERHLRTHAGVKPYGCTRCEKKFADKYYLKQHGRNVHGVELSEEEEEGQVT